MDTLKTVGILIAAAIGEIGGTYAVWRWRRAGSALPIALLGVVALIGYAVVQTYQPESRYGRIYAAYAGVFLIGAMLAGWMLDGAKPDRFDAIGSAIALVGAAVILWGRRLFG